MKQNKVSVQLKGIDWITLLFCAWMLLLIAFGWNRVNNPIPHFISYLSIVAGISLLLWLTAFMQEFSRVENCNNGVCRRVWPAAYKVLLFIRSYYPVLLYIYFFESNTATNMVLFRDWLDPWFMKIDYAMFGYYPSLEWGLKYSQIWIKEILYFAYFSYYLMIIGLPVYFYIRRREAMGEVVFVLSFVFYCCYFIYSWLPVMGGRYFEAAMQYTQESGIGIFSKIMAYIYTHSPHLGGAFPSSHIAIALVLSVLALKYFRILGITMLIITFLLSIATVYCHYHWFIDSVFGVITGIFGYLSAQNFYKRLSESKI